MSIYSQESGERELVRELGVPDVVTLRSGGGGSPVDFAGFGSLGLQCLASADSAPRIDRGGENIGRGGDAGTQARIIMRMTRAFDRLQADRAKFPGWTDFKFRANILNMEWFFVTMQWNRSSQWTYTKVEEGDRVVAKGTVEGYVCTATFSPHHVQDLLLADVFVGGGFHSFTLELISYREAVRFLRMFMDLNID